MIHTRIATKMLLCTLMASIACQSMAMYSTARDDESSNSLLDLRELSPRTARSFASGTARYMPGAPTAAAVFAVGSWILLCTRPSKSDFVAHGKVRELLNVHHAITDTRNYFANLKDVYWDRFIGQKSKESGLFANKETGVVSCKESCKAQGVLGTIHSKLPGFEETTKGLTIIGALYAMASAGKTEKLLQHFGLVKKEDSANPLLAEAKKQTAAMVLQARIAAYHLSLQHPNAPAELRIA